MGKTLIIGLDGATFDLMNPWIEEGRLPNLARLMKEGSYGRLRSTPNKVSPAAWTSFSTGKNPGKHGIYHFHGIDPSTFEFQIYNASHRDAEPIWSYLSSVGKRVGVFNVPMTYPVDKVNGFMVAGWDAPSAKAVGFCCPEDLARQLRKKFRYIPTTPAIEVFKTNNKPHKALKRMKRDLKTRRAIVKHLMKEKDWDFMVAVFVATDQVQHYFWPHAEQNTSFRSQKNSELLENAAKSVYENCDRTVGELIADLQEDDTVIIMSDHGATVNSSGSLYLPKWLEELGLLTKRSDEAGSRNKTSGFTQRRVINYFKKLAHDRFSAWLGHRSKNVLKKLFGSWLGLGTGTKVRLSNYDWSKTKVYTVGSNLRINLKGREKHGIVSPGKEYEELQDFLVEKLSEITDIKTGQKVVKNVFKRQDVYHGKHVDEAWDLITSWTEGLEISGLCCTDKDGKEIKITEKISSPNAWSGEHSDYGIFIAKGPHIKKGNRIDNAQIMDIAPSVLHLMGVSVPDDMDGKVLTDIMFEDSLKSNPVKYTKVINSNSAPEKCDYSDQEAKEVERQLKKLGYL